MPNDDLKPVLEALLFACEKPMSIEQIRQAFEESLSEADIRNTLSQLKEDYESTNRGFRLFEIAGGFQLVTDPRFSSYLRRFYQEREKKRLSQASLETLSIIAYRQPITRADIEFVRGVNVDGAIKTLLEKGLIRITGRKEVPGRPMLYGTTSLFLEHFGLNTIKELPPLTEFTEKDIASHLLPPELKEKMGQEPCGGDTAEAPEEDAQAVEGQETIGRERQEP